MKITQATLKAIIQEEVANMFNEDAARIAKADRRRAGMQAGEVEAEDVDEGAFAPNHYCVHHGGVQHEGEIKLAEAVSHNYNFKLGDFNLAREIPDYIQKLTVCGTYRYMAPEVLSREKYNSEVDLYELKI